MDTHVPAGICPKPASLAPVARDAALDRLLDSAHGRAAQAEWDEQLLRERAQLISQRKAAQAAYESWNSTESKRVFALAAEVEKLERQFEARRDELRAAGVSYDLDRQERRAALANIANQISSTLPSAVSELLARADVIRAAAPFDRLGVVERVAAALAPLTPFIQGETNVLDPNLVRDVRAAVESVGQFAPEPMSPQSGNLPGQMAEWLGAAARAGHIR